MVMDLTAEAVGAEWELSVPPSARPPVVCLRCGHRPGSFKWRAFEDKGLCKHELEADAVVEPKAKTLSEMNKTELLEVAAAEGVQLPEGASNKTIADAIREARKAGS